MKTKDVIQIILIIWFGISMIIFAIKYYNLAIEYNELVDANDLLTANTNLWCCAGCLYGLATSLQEIDKNITTMEQRINLTNGCKEYCHYDSPNEE